MEKRWNILSCDETRAAALQRELKINIHLCKILVQRGHADYNAAKDFFRPSLDMLHSPWLMKDMQKAVGRIGKAISHKEKILVYGDYDVDGTTSVALMYQFLCDLYDAALIDFYIPHRYREGYGVSRAGIEFARDNGFTLIICLDCGIKSVELIAEAKEMGIDFVVCDHHLPGNTIPDAAAVLNPKQTDCNYPYKELCGCGVGFKLISALAETYNLVDKCHCYLDMVATAIAADIVPMTGENRVLAYFGLHKINTEPCEGIAALKVLGNIQKQMSITNVVFIIAPRVNAAGRMDDARKAVELFIQRDPGKAREFAAMLHSDNSERKEADSSITIEALELLRTDADHLTKKSSVVFQEHWHKGVVGIVASRLTEHYYRPTVVLTRSGDMVAGSARSVPGFNLYEAIYECREYLTAYGGHFAAAGLSMLPENVPAFTKKFDEVVSSTIADELLIPEIIIDAEINFSDINDSFYNIVCQMEPFGPENMRPVFLTRNVIDTGYSRILKELHLRVSVSHNNIVMNGIGFNMSEKYELLANRCPVDIVYTLDENEYNGNKDLQLRVVDIRPSAEIK